MIGRVLICDGCGGAGYPAATSGLARTTRCAGTIRRVRLGRYARVYPNRPGRPVSGDYCATCRGRGRDRERAHTLATGEPNVARPTFLPEARYL